MNIKVLSDKTVGAMGFAGTTPVHVKEDGGEYEARAGIAIMGAAQMSPEEFKACEYNPFHEKFCDNYASGKGDTEEAAVKALIDDTKRMADVFFAF